MYTNLKKWMLYYYYCDYINYKYWTYKKKYLWFINKINKNTVLISNHRYWDIEIKKEFIIEKF